MSAHHCHAIGCRTPVPPRMHMCLKHWRMLPKTLRDEIWRTYRRGQERDKRPSADYLEAFGKTTAFIRAKEAEQ